jgi:hypothetical protein
LIPRELNRNHVLRALERIEEEGIPRRRASTKFCLVHNGRHFAPKYVISEACRALMPDGLDPQLFSGGVETNDVLAALGFTVVPCTCGGLVSPTPGGVAAPGLLVQPATQTATIVSACLQEDPDWTNATRMELLASVLEHVRDRGPVLLVLPAGYFSSDDQPPHEICQWAADEIAYLLQEHAEGSTVCLGVDGRDGRDQMGLAIRREGLVAMGRKFFPAPGEEIDRADGPFEREQGLPRLFSFAGRQYYLAVCYDGFGMKRTSPTGSPAIDGIVNLVHYFAPPREPGAGAGYFARYGFAGASRTWDCPVYGAVVFGGTIQESWPTAVLWNQGDLDSKRWTYSHNPLQPEEVQWLDDHSETVRLTFYHP